MRGTKVSCNFKLYSENQTIYSLKDKSYMSKVSNHVDMPSMAKTCFLTDAHEQIRVASCNE